MVSRSISEEFTIDGFDGSVRPILINLDMNVGSIIFSQAYQTYHKEFIVGVKFELSFAKGTHPLIFVPSLPSLSSFFFVSLSRNSPLALSLSALPYISPSTSRISLSFPGLTRTESPSKRGSQRTPDPTLRVRRHGVSSSEHRPFRGHFRPNHGELAGV
ncbi:hypothetical protein DVH24_031777 [Malus domestica]|uniref:Uncharacterized protein n=1 Tax=Malus domestica TaxID=3750 RepID=A0A498J1R6_MALDO|nr:hypothetical protein DVH24_031777 [Malus domestica]